MKLMLGFIRKWPKIEKSIEHPDRNYYPDIPEHSDRNYYPDIPEHPDRNYYPDIPEHSDRN